MGPERRSGTVAGQVDSNDADATTFNTIAERLQARVHSLSQSMTRRRLARLAGHSFRRSPASNPR